MNGMCQYDSDMAPDAAAAAQREAHDRASLEQNGGRLLQASTKLKYVNGTCEIADLKPLREAHWHE